MKALIKNGTIDGIYEVVPEGMTGDIVEIPDYDYTQTYVYTGGEIQPLDTMLPTPEPEPLTQEEQAEQEKHQKIQNILFLESRLLGTLGQINTFQALPVESIRNARIAKCQEDFQTQEAEYMTAVAEFVEEYGEDAVSELVPPEVGNAPNIENSEE